MRFNWLLFILAAAFITCTAAFTTSDATSATTEPDISITAEQFYQVADKLHQDHTIKTNQSTNPVSTSLQSDTSAELVRLTTDTTSSPNSTATTAPPVERTPPMPYPVTRLGPVVYVDCDFTLLCQNPASQEWEPADYLEPEFEIMPENVLWIIEPGRSYQMQVDFGGRAQNIDPTRIPSDTSYRFYVIYTGLLPEGSLGTFQIEFAEQVDDVFVVYRGALKFVADDGADLFCVPTPSMNADGVFSVEFRPRTEASRYFDTVDPQQLNYCEYSTNTFFQIDVPISVLLDFTQATVYDTDLSRYLYPHGVPRELQWYFDQFPLDPSEYDEPIAVG